MRLSRTLSLLVCFWGTLAAYPGEAPDAEFKTSAVAVFKNGLAFVVKQGDVRLEDGAGRIVPIPNATLGSLWMTPNDAGVSLDEVVAYRYKVPVQHNLTALADVLMANAGKVVTVGYSNQKEYKEYTGEIVGFRPQEHAPPEPAPSPTPSAENSYFAVTATSTAPPPTVAPEFLLLKAEGKLLALYFRDITQVTLPAEPALQAKQEEERKALRF